MVLCLLQCNVFIFFPCYGFILSIMTWFHIWLIFHFLSHIIIVLGIILILQNYKLFLQENFKTCFTLFFKYPLFSMLRIYQPKSLLYLSEETLKMVKNCYRDDLYKLITHCKSYFKRSDVDDKILIKTPRKKYPRQMAYCKWKICQSQY